MDHDSGTWMNFHCRWVPATWWMIGALLLTSIIYWPGLHGSWLFDDYPNIVDNHGLQISNAHTSSLIRAALSSPASEFKRPLASLSFAANYLAAGLDPFSWKATNLFIHLLNGWLVFLLTWALLLSAEAHSARDQPQSEHSPSYTPPKANRRTGIVAALIATGWLLLPINLTGVLYVVQRMESLANVFVLLGLLGYVTGRQRMMAGRRGLWLCIPSVLAATITGLLVKETAVMLPLYAFLVECLMFRFACGPTLGEGNGVHRGLAWFFALALALPMMLGLVWLVPSVLQASAWATRDFTLSTRLLSEARIVGDYLMWTLLPTPGALSFYHDDFRISTGLLSPWTTLASIALVAALARAVWTQRRRRPLVALGLALYLGCHLLTGTILPLELVYEHRNYFASFGLLLALVPWLTATGSIASETTAKGSTRANKPTKGTMRRYALLAVLLLWWGGLTAMTAWQWGNPMRLAQTLAERAPESPRAQYELGRSYIIYSQYDPASPFTKLAYAPLEKAASFPESSILPQQALIFMNSRMGLPLKPQWWDSLTAKLKAHKPGVQDESSLAALARCAQDRACTLPRDRMVQAFEAALGHSHPSARLQAIYGDYAWNQLHDHKLGLRMIEGAVQTAPHEPAYRIALIRMLVAADHPSDAMPQMRALRQLNIGGRLDGSILELQRQLDTASKPDGLRP